METMVRVTWNRVQGYIGIGFRAFRVAWSMV